MAQEFDQDRFSFNGEKDDDVDSLFDGDDDAEQPSLFPEVAAVGPSRPPDSEQERPQEAFFPEAQAPQLSLPTVPDPLGASLSRQDGHTSGDIVVSTQDSDHGHGGAALEADFEALWESVSVTGEDQAVNVHTGSPASEVAQDASSPEELLNGNATLEADLEALWESVTGEDQAVDAHAGSPASEVAQDDNASLPAPTASSPEEVLNGNAALEADFEALWESGTGEDQAVNAHTASQASEAAQDDNFIPVSRIPGYRYANSETNARIRLPRRVDLDQKLAESLSQYVTLNRQAKLEDLYKLFKLDKEEGKRLSGEIKQRLKQPPLSELVKATSGVLETKQTLVKLAFCMLTSENWGTTWFGDGCTTAASRSLFWPQDSTLLLLRFVMLLYRHFDLQRQVYLAGLRSRAKAQSQNPDTGSARSPSPTRPAPVALLSPPESPSEKPIENPPKNLPENSPHDPPDGPPENHPQNHPGKPPPAGDGQVFFDSLVQNVAVAKKRKRDDSVPGLAGPTSYELDIPPNARLTYNVYVKDKTDGSDLGPPASYRHTDSLIACGAFSRLRSSFEAAGQAPTFEMQTPFGRRIITSEDEWERAVLLVYNVRRSGGVVEVDVFV